MNNDIVFTKISGPEFLDGSWFVTLENQREEIKISIDEAYAPLITIADRDNEKYVKVNFYDLCPCLHMGEVSLHIVQYDLQKCYVQFELLVNEHRFIANIETWRAIAFAKAYSLPINCSEMLWYDIIADLTNERMSSYHTGFIHMALPFVQRIVYDTREYPSVRERAATLEFAMYQHLGKRQELAKVMGSLLRK